MGVGTGTPHPSTVTYLTSVTVPIRTDDGFPRRPDNVFSRKKGHESGFTGPKCVCDLGGGCGPLPSDDHNDDILGRPRDGTGDKEKEKKTRWVGTCLWMMETLLDRIKTLKDKVVGAMCVVMFIR